MKFSCAKPFPPFIYDMNKSSSAIISLIQGLKEVKSLMHQGNEEYTGIYNIKIFCTKFTLWPLDTIRCFQLDVEF